MWKPHGISARGSELRDLKVGSKWCYQNKKHLTVKVLELLGPDIRYKKEKTGEVLRCSVMGFVRVYRKLVA
jgi:hypothetical protein